MKAAVVKALTSGVDLDAVAPLSVTAVLEDAGRREVEGWSSWSLSGSSSYATRPGIGHIELRLYFAL